jgi:DNA-binding CsgD family transcriptional regulator
MNEIKYIGMDVHQTSTSIVVLNGSGRVLTSAVVETQGQALLTFIQGQRGTLHLTLEEGTCSAWLYDLLAPHVPERYVRLSSAFASREPSKRGALTPREEEIVGLLLRRLSNKEIASALGISERTVRFHLQSIFDKVGVRDRHSVIEVARATAFMPADDLEKAGRRTHGRYYGRPGSVRKPA